MKKEKENQMTAGITQSFLGDRVKGPISENMALEYNTRKQYKASKLVKNIGHQPLRFLHYIFPISPLAYPASISCLPTDWGF